MPIVWVYVKALAMQSLTFNHAFMEFKLYPEYIITLLLEHFNIYNNI